MTVISERKEDLICRGHTVKLIKIDCVHLHSMNEFNDNHSITFWDIIVPKWNVWPKGGAIQKTIWGSPKSEEFILWVQRRCTANSIIIQQVLYAVSFQAMLNTLQAIGGCKVQKVQATAGSPTVMADQQNRGKTIVSTISQMSYPTMGRHLTGFKFTSKIVSIACLSSAQPV